MCSCINIQPGTYSNQVKLIAWWNFTTICIDLCLFKEIYFLWENEVRTTGCCCGHNKTKPMINVIPEHHELMIKLGYTHWINEFDVTCWEPKSIN